MENQHLTQYKQEASLRSMSNQLSELREVMEDERVAHKKARQESEDEIKLLSDDLHLKVHSLNSELDDEREEVTIRGEIVLEKNKEIVTLESHVDALMTEKSQLQQKHIDLEHRYSHRAKQWNTFAGRFDTFWQRLRSLFFRPPHYKTILVHDEE